MGKDNELSQLELKPTKKEKERLKKEVKSRLDGRWMILILFLGTIFLSLFFYLQAQAPQWWQRLFSPQVIISKPPGG